MAAKKDKKSEPTVETVRASRGGHTFHERWAARRALQLVFAKDGLTAIAIEGLSPTEEAKPGQEAEEVADLVLYYGGENFASSATVQTAQFKYKATGGAVTASYLKKTVEKFASSIDGYERNFESQVVDARLTFSFVTNAQFSADLWEAIAALKAGKTPEKGEACRQCEYLAGLCKGKGVDAQRLFSRTEFRAAEDDLSAQNSKLRRTMVDWSGGSDGRARSRLFELTELVRDKAGPRGQGNNLVKREDVLDALNCQPEDLFPAETRFIKVGDIVPRAQLSDVSSLTTASALPVFIHAAGGVGKTVFVESLASTMLDSYEVVVFDCFGGGAYRSPDQARHRPDVGFVQIANELASRGLCDPLLPGDTDSVALANAARRRLRQAASAIKVQSKKLGILIVIDAADNAQVEADNRKDEAFPSLLLASLDREAIDGVKLILTARTHRMSKVIKRAKVVPFPLKPFTVDEARAFLASRRENVSNVEFSLAFSRSAGNARVLAYLVDTWDANVAAGAPDTEITAEELIAQKCQKIVDDLHVAGWPDNEVREFFAAIALLPPPMPLDELAAALGWESEQVKSAASDLAPMLEVVPHQGAIFRDEPTETYVHDTYSNEIAAQQAIAQRLQQAQGSSSYAAEAFPNFLVAINDARRAYELADSKEFPSTIQSDFGRRRLQLARLNAAFKLAVKSVDLDQALKLTMRLAQVAAANIRGDEFIRRSPGLAVALGDHDAYRRLFMYRSGWRGARDARLTIAHAFSDEMDEAEIHCDRTIGWINWHVRLPRDENEPAERRSGPEAQDFAAALLVNILKGNYGNIDSNLARWNRRFALSVCREAFKLVREYESISGTAVLDPLAAFAGTNESKSFVLKVGLLRVAGLSSQRRKALAKSLQQLPRGIKESEAGYDPDRETDADVVYAGFAALLHESGKSAAKILRSTKLIRASNYDYGERYGGYSKVWIPTLRACTQAWTQGRKVAIHDLLPYQVKVTSELKTFQSLGDLRQHLSALRAPRRKNYDGTWMKRTKELLFNYRECQDICKAIEAIMQVVQPVERAILAGTALTPSTLGDLVSSWAQQLPSTDYGHDEEAHVIIRRAVGMGFVRLLLLHAETVSANDATKLVEIVSGKRFGLRERSGVLALIASRPGFEDLAGKFAAEIADGIRKDDYIEQRGEDYASLAEGLLSMSVPEAKRYYRDGLAELDKLGSNDYELLYSVLEYAAAQGGGAIAPALGHRMMNLSQTILREEPHKFGWTLFGKACAKSVGFSAITKLVRWADQDVAEFSYGLPQLACFLAAEGKLDPKRAAAILLVCEDHGWHAWSVGDGLRDLLRATSAIEDQRAIFDTVVSKLKREHSDGGWPSVWQGLLTVAADFPGLVEGLELASLNALLGDARREQDESNARSSSRGFSDSYLPVEPKKDVDPSEFIDALIAKCDPTSASDLDDAVVAIETAASLPYDTKARFLAKLRETCPYSKRLDHLFALAEAAKIEINQVIDLIAAAVEAWKTSSAHVIAETKQVISRLLEQKGSELFDLRYSSMARELGQLTGICGDRGFVVRLVLQTIVDERLELDANEWLQLATTLTTESSPAASREALEDFLSGPAAGIADDIGEGAHKAAFEIDDPSLIAGLFFHLLGDNDAYIRWSVARALGGLAALGLKNDLEALVDGFDERSVPALASPDRNLSFQNSQQWLLMGLARAALDHRRALEVLKSKLLVLTRRDDIHILNKRHLVRCLTNLGMNDEIAGLKSEVAVDPKGVSVAKGWPQQVAATLGFTFDYEFMKSEVSRLARLFWISDGESTDAIATAIKSKWPDATSMDYFPGHDRYRRERNDRYEFYREHVQKHALISAATTLRNSRPIARQSYDQDTASPFDEFIRDYDVTFPDGSWLADHKDPLPQVAKARFLAPRDGKNENLIDRDAALKELGLIDSSVMVPLYGTWRSPDGVHVRIMTGLGASRGIVGRCDAFSKRKDHELWIPMIWHDGYDDQHRQESPFEPLVWAQENYGLGVDAGEKDATRGAAARPRLGFDATRDLHLVPDGEAREWMTQDGEVALKSQVWGEWKPDPDDHRSHRPDDGEILWANALWLDRTLPASGKQLVYEITLTKYKERRSYSEGSGAKAVYVATRNPKSGLRVWHAKRASAELY